MSWVAKCECGNHDPKKFVEDPDAGEIVCKDCGKVSVLHGDDAGFSMLETLGSIPDPQYRASNSNNEILGSLRRVGISCLANWSDASWQMLVEELSRKIGAPEHIRDSVVQYRMRHRESMRNFNRREAATALLFIYSKNYLKASNSLNNLFKATGADRAKTGRYLTHFILDDGLKTAYKQPEDYITLYGGRLNVTQDVVGRGQEIARLYRQSSINSITPRAIAASALYIACRENGHKYTQGEIASTFGLAEYTVRECCGNMKKTLR